MSGKTLLLVGSGPGIGVSVASAFAQRGFDHIALIARDRTNLLSAQSSVIKAAEEVQRQVTVKLFQVDITNFEALKRTLEEVRQWKIPDCVYFNAARVEPATLMERPVEDIEQAFRTTNLALYITACWAMPLLLQLAANSPAMKPSFLVTTSHIATHPVPEFFLLSMVKASQSNFVNSLAKAYTCRGVHVGLISVAGQVSSTSPFLNPLNIAHQAWELYSQDPSKWTMTIEVAENGTVSFPLFPGAEIKA